jgi:hypothetical protein
LAPSFLKPFYQPVAIESGIFQLKPPIFTFPPPLHPELLIIFKFKNFFPQNSSPLLRKLQLLLNEEKEEQSIYCPVEGGSVYFLELKIQDV